MRVASRQTRLALSFAIASEKGCPMDTKGTALLAQITKVLALAASRLKVNELVAFKEQAAAEVAKLSAKVKAPPKG